jgi:sugar lactone lactonase YvrE
MDEDGDHARFLWKPKPPQVPEGLAVSPDGNQLLVTIISFAEGGTWNSSMWLMGSDGKDPHRLDIDLPVDPGAADGE